MRSEIKYSANHPGATHRQCRIASSTKERKIEGPMENIFDLLNTPASVFAPALKRNLNKERFVGDRPNLLLKTVQKQLKTEDKSSGEKNGKKSLAAKLCNDLERLGETRHFPKTRNSTLIDKMNLSIAPGASKTVPRTESSQEFSVNVLGSVSSPEPKPIWRPVFVEGIEETKQQDGSSIGVGSSLLELEHSTSQKTIWRPIVFEDEKAVAHGEGAQENKTAGTEWIIDQEISRTKEPPHFHFEYSINSLLANAARPLLENLPYTTETNNAAHYQPKSAWAASFNY